jgi:hypothetical protein
VGKTISSFTALTTNNSARLAILLELLQATGKEHAWDYFPTMKLLKADQLLLTGLNMIMTDQKEAMSDNYLKIHSDI